MSCGRKHGNGLYSGEDLRLLIAYDHHFLRAADGAVYVGHPMAVPGYRAWKPYLTVFESVVVLARVRRLASLEAPTSARADGPGVQFHDVPDYLGPWEYAQRFWSVRAAVRQGVGQADAHILKVPGVLAQRARNSLAARGRPYAVEVIADPWDMYAPGAVPSVVRPWVRWRWTQALRVICHEADAVSYVTREALQRRYPPGPKTWSTFVSDVDLQSVAIAPDELIQCRIRNWNESLRCDPARRIKVGFVGALGQLYKAPDVLLRAAAVCLTKGLRLEVLVVGDGKYRGSLENLAKELGIEPNVRVLGSLPPGAAIQSFLDSLDLFVLPSRQEGLPRALVEAMARGCPCLGSTVGGIPELLADEDLVRPDDVAGLAVKFEEALANPARLERMARRNHTRAAEYRPEVLNQRRDTFLRKVREQALGRRS